MASKSSVRRKNPQTGLYYPNTVPEAAIRRYAREIAKHFHPERIILFGSYAWGDPTPDSDVDLLVVMRTRNQLEQAVRIDEALGERGFALDLIVRTSRTLADGLRAGDTFLQDIVARGKVLYEKADQAVAAQGRARPRRREAPVHPGPLADR